MQFDRDEQRHAHAAAQALRRHRHGARAPRRCAAARAQQLRHRPVPGPDRGGRASTTGARTSSRRRSRVIADHIRACAFLIVDGVIRATKAAATCCAGSSAARSATATSSGRRSRSSTSWCPRSSRVMGDAYPELPREQDHVVQVLRGRGRALRRDAGARHEDARGRARRSSKSGTRCCRARRCSRCTTPTASRSISPPTSAASAAFLRPGRVRARPWTGSASARARRQRSRWRSGLDYARRQDRVRRLRHAGRGRARGRAVSRRQRRRCAGDRAASASSSSIARRSTPSPAARSAIAASCRASGACLTLFAVARHAEDPGRRLRPPR